MSDFLDGILLPFRLAWQGTKFCWGAYMAMVQAVGQPWSGMIHSSVMLSLGQAVAWVLLR